MNRPPAGRLSYCRICHADYMKARRTAEPDRDRVTSRERTVRLRTRNQRHVWAYLDSHPCVDCTESDPVVLQFDHVRGIKWKNISTLVGHGYSIAQINTEIAKCDVRCANCHIRVTAQRARWAKVEHWDIVDASRIL